MTGSKITVRIENLAKVCAQLVIEGVIFIATPKVGSEDEYIIEFTGGF